MLTRFTEVYKNQAVPKLMEQFKYTNIHQVPTFEKVSIGIPPVENIVLIEVFVTLFIAKHPLYEYASKF